MSKRPRIFLPGVSVHVIHRGHNRLPVFGDSTDYEHFLVLLEAAAQRHEIAVHGYALMTNHVHLVTTPSREPAIPRAMRELGQRYVRYFNHKYQRTGTLWGGRYRAILIGDERYWLTCLRYVEQNPVRARIVHSPELYRWSSYRIHALGDPPGWLVDHDVFHGLGATAEERQTAYRELCEARLTDEELIRQRLGVAAVIEARGPKDAQELVGVACV